MSQYARLDQRMYDYTLLNDFEKCERRGYWNAVRNVVGKEPHPALHFGAAIHAGTHAWRDAGKRDDAGYAAYEQAMVGMPEDAKRTAEHGRLLLRGYFTRYREEPFTVLAGEVSFALPMPNGSTLVGRVDGVVEWGEYLYVLETKTTSGLGADFMRQFKPNLQIDVYCYAVQRAFGRCDGALIDAISTAKLKGGTEEGYLRDISDRTPTDVEAFERYYAQSVTALEEACAAWNLSHVEGNATVPPAPPADAMRHFRQHFAACYYYGPCPYLPLCLYRQEPTDAEYASRQPQEITNELSVVAARYHADDSNAGAHDVLPWAAPGRPGRREGDQGGARCA